MWFYYWYGEINELLKKFRFWLSTFVWVFTKAVPRIYHHAPSLSQAFDAWRKSGIDSGVNYYDLGVATRGEGETIPREPKSPTNVTSTSFNTVHWLPNAIRFEHGGAKLASCPGRHQASLCPWVWWIFQQIISWPSTVTSHWWLSILDTICYMKTWTSTLKSFTQLKLIKSPDNYFLLLWNNSAFVEYLLFVYEFLGTNYCIHKRWPMVLLRLSFAPLDHTSSNATAHMVNLMTLHGRPRGNLSICHSGNMRRSNFKMHVWKTTLMERTCGQPNQLFLCGIQLHS